MNHAIECSRTNFIDLRRRFHMKARASFKDDAIFSTNDVICFFGLLVKVNDHDPFQTKSFLLSSVA
ncbi:hypothetical protein [Helicoverpa armigera NPV NNg1]|uniref:Uncharacterized protein n=1 Tax=Helicoverpa armigera NPV NNg1 TaxID=566972 RepID=B5X0B4_9ABAC|nr:hypothetical protein [Helicoverpa armigera NPV NNg1]